MKRFLVILLILVMSVLAYGQIKRMYVWKGTVTTAWTKIYRTTPGAKMLALEVVNDASSASADTLWVAWNQDTTSAYMFPLLYGESKYWPSAYIDTLRLKTSANTIPVRVDYH